MEDKTILSSFKSETIMLINPPLIFREGFRRPSVSIPLGLLYIATALSNQKKVLIKDYIGNPDFEISDYEQKGNISQEAYHLGLSMSAIKDDLQRTSIPNVVAISCSFLSHAYETVQGTIDIIREISPATKIIVGGSGLLRNIHSIIKGVDLFLFGEGERRLLSILNGDDIAADEIIENNNGVLSLFDRKEYLSKDELNKYAVLDYALIDLEKYIYLNQKGVHSRFSKTARSVSFITSRGCPFNCSFCMIKSVQGRSWRPYSPEMILKNLENLRSTYNIEHLHVEDDNFALDTTRFIEIIKMIKKLDMTWDPSNGLYAQKFTEKEIVLMKENGCSSIKIAPETGSQRVVDEVILGKPISIRKVRDIAKWSHAAGLEIQGFIIIGFPQETREDLKETIDFAEELKENFNVRWSVSLYRPFPETRLRQYCIENNMLKEEGLLETLGSSSKYCVKHPVFSEDELNSVVERIQSSWVEIK